MAGRIPSRSDPAPARTCTVNSCSPETQLFPDLPLDTICSMKNRSVSPHTIDESVPQVESAEEAMLKVSGDGCRLRGGVGRGGGGY